jgi:hypothetical protein
MHHALGLDVTDRRTLEAAASALRRLPPKARARHLADRLLDLARRMEAVERERQNDERRGDVAN